jgi:large subunit ribosomal protein L11
VGPALARYGISVAQFCQQFNDATESKRGFNIPVEITIYEDRSFSLKLKQPPVSDFLKRAAGIEKGSSDPKRTIVGKITAEQLKDIAQKKMSDLNTNDLEKAVKIVRGTAENMGIKIE